MWFFVQKIKMSFPKNLLWVLFFLEVFFVNSNDNRICVLRSWFFLLYIVPSHTFFVFLLQCVLILSGVCAIRFSSDSKFSSLSFFFYNLLQNTKKYLSSFFSKQKLCYYVISKISFLWLWLIKKYQTSKEEWNSLHLVLPKRQYPLTIPLSSNSVCFIKKSIIILNSFFLNLDFCCHQFNLSFE